MARDTTTRRTIASNRSARFEFHLLDEAECGIQLTGTEVKSLRGGRCSLDAAFGLFRGNELYLVEAHIPEYAFGNIHNHAPKRDRKLLMHRKEMERWHRAVKEKGVTIVPLEVFFKGHLVKVRIALAKGKKLYDKREATKERETKRETDRALTRRR